MSKVIGLKSSYIRAASTPDGIPTFWVSGVVGYDFKGLDLAAIASNMGGELRLLLDTVGGDAADAFAFYDAVRTKGMKVHVEGYGRVASAGTIIMAAAGLKRSALAPNAEYLIHEASGSDADAVERYNERMARIYSELSGISEKEVRKIMKADTFMSAQEAKKLKLVGAVLQHEAIAAQYKPMEQNVEQTTAEEVVETVEQAPIEQAPEVTNDTDTVEQEIPVTVPEAIHAAIKGHIIARVNVAKEYGDTIAQLTSEVKAKAAELDEVKAEVESLREKLTASEDARSNAEAKASELEPKLAEITAQLETLKASPVPSASVKAEAPEVQVPGGGPGATKADKVKAKQQQREAEMRAAFERFAKKPNNA